MAPPSAIVARVIDDDERLPRLRYLSGQRTWRDR